MIILKINRPNQLKLSTLVYCKIASSQYLFFILFETSSNFCQKLIKSRYACVKTHFFYCWRNIYAEKDMGNKRKLDDVECPNNQVLTAKLILNDNNL